MTEAIYNADELVPPSFMTEAYIVDVLRQVEDDPELHVINYEVKPGSSAGDHYASIMFKIIATYGSRNKVVTDRRFIFKTLPEVEGQKKDMLQNSPIFKNEILMYTQTLPAMEKILEQHGETTFWPRLVYSQPDPFVLMFDDLTVEKYQVVYDPLGFDKVLMIVDKIAKYHALSLVLLENGHDQITKYEPGLTADMKDMFSPMIKHIQRIAQIVKTWPGFEVIGEKLYKVGPKVSESLLNRDVPTKDRFTVLVHGDFHLRNLMFQKDSQGDPCNVLFLDFQMPFYYSPALDLIGLLGTMGDSEVRKRKDEVIKLYHEYLVANLKMYGYTGKLPSVIDVQVECLRMSDYDVFMTLLAIPMFSIKGVEMSELFDASDDSVVAIEIDKYFNNPVFVEEMKPIIKSFYYRGTFDE